jgi:hypothetical protein
LKTIKEKKLAEIPVPSDKEVEELLIKEAGQITVDASNFILGQRVFPMTLKEFYDAFLDKNGAYNYKEYYKLRPGNKDVKLIEGLSTFAEVADSSPDEEKYHIDLIMPIVGVPFCKQSRFIKDITIKKSRK